MLATLALLTITLIYLFILETNMRYCDVQQVQVVPCPNMCFIAIGNVLAGCRQPGNQAGTLTLHTTPEEQ